MCPHCYKIASIINQKHWNGMSWFVASWILVYVDVRSFKNILKGPECNQQGFWISEHVSEKKSVLQCNSCVVSNKYVVYEKQKMYPYKNLYFLQKLFIWVKDWSGLVRDSSQVIADWKIWFSVSHSTDPSIYILFWIDLVCIGPDPVLCVPSVSGMKLYNLKVLLWMIMTLPARK